MKMALLFDSDGRCIGRETRTEDQWDGGTPPSVAGMKFVPVADGWAYQESHRWWLCYGVVKERTKVDLPRPTRQRIRSQPAFRWLKSDTPGATDWMPRTVYQAGQVISPGYWALTGGMSGDVRPAFDKAAHWDYMPPVVWVRTETVSTEEWKPLSLWAEGETIAVSGEYWSAVQAGASGLAMPDFTGDEVIDRDSLALPVPDIDGPIYLKVGGQRLLAPVVITATEPTRMLVELDCPGHYSDAYAITVEHP